MILACHNLEKSFGDQVIVKHGSFHIEEHEKAALVGMNGAGKSTILKMLIREIPADGGDIVLTRGKQIGYLSQHPMTDSSKTIYEEVKTAKQYLVELENQIRAIELELKTLYGSELESRLSTYHNLTSRFERENGYAYESKGSVYFDVAKYNKDHHYGVLSGRNLDDVLNTTRELDGQDEKHNPADFALWKCAQPEHIMRWPSPWSNGFPGWHCECTAMGRKYLGETFDIHGGGMDLVFPHHECEIAQAVASEGHQMVRYWMHNNMITINGQKMGKSLGNFITLDEFFTGSNKLLTQAYSPMTIRFFILQAHYRSTVDFSNEALQAAEKGLERLLEGVKNLDRITPAKATSGIEPKGLREKCYEAMNDDLNTPIVISHLFDATRMINTVIDKKATISAEDLEELKSVFHLFVFDILGLKAEAENNAAREEAYGKVVDMLLEQRMQAKANKDWATSDKIRDNLAALGFEVKDTKDGFTWKLNK